MAHIYQIVNLDDGRVYIGSTKQKVKYRVSCHKSKSKNNINKCATKDFNFENIEVKILQSFDIYDKTILLQAEKDFIFKLDCVNKYSPIQTKEEAKKYQNEYKKINKEKHLYYAEEYRENNKEYYTLYNKKYYQINKDELNKKILCTCGSSISKSVISRHQKTKKHLKLKNT